MVDDHYDQSYNFIGGDLMLYCVHRLLCYFSDINVFYNNCMMYDILKDMLKEVCLEYYKKGYEDGVINADIEKFNNELEVNFDE